MGGNYEKSIYNQLMEVMGRLDAVENVAFLPACLTPGLFPSIISIGRPACLLIGRGRIRSVGTVIVNNALKPFVVVT